MPIIPEYVEGFPWNDPLYTSVQPFTYRDGTTYLEILRAVDSYVKKLAGIINDSNDEAASKLQAQIGALQSAVNAALDSQASQVQAELDDVLGQLQSILDDLTASSITFSDPVMAAIVGDGGTVTRGLLDGLYRKRRNDTVDSLYSASGVNTTRTVFLGSSTTSRGGWVREFARVVGIAHHKDFGLVHGSYVQLSGYNRAGEAAGNVFVNGGKSGSTASNYLTAAHANEVIAAAPKIVVHMVGSNDYKQQVSPELYATRLEAAVGLLQSLNAHHVFVHSFERLDVPGGHSWASYGAAMARVAANVGGTFVDVSGYFTPAGIPNSDPYGLVDSDLIHLTPQGDIMLATAVFKELEITGRPAPAYTTDLSGVVTSDNFTGSGDMLGRSTDARYGGEVKTWEGFGTGFENNGVFLDHIGQSVSGLYVTLGNTLPEVSFFVQSMPATGAFYIDVSRRLSSVASTDNSVIRLAVNSTGRCRFEVRGNDGAYTQGKFISLDPAGKMVSVRRTRSNIEMLVDGVVVLREPDPGVEYGPYAGVATTPACGPFRLRRFMLKGSLNGG